MERKWKVCKLFVYYELHEGFYKTYNAVFNDARATHFSTLISQNGQNPKVQFKKFDCIIGAPRLVFLILSIVHSSLTAGLLPIYLKTALVEPLLKKPNLYPSILDNYRAVS